MKNLTWQNPEQLFVAQELINKVKSKCCGIKVQLKNGNGYDHNFVLNTKGDLSTVAARLSSPESGIVLEVYTDEPGIQVYTGNFLDGTVKGKKGVVYNQRASVCLETQHFPDSPNKPRWPSVYLEPGQTYSSRCIYKFSVEK